MVIESKGKSFRVYIPISCLNVLQSKLRQQEELKKAQLEQQRAEAEAQSRLQEVELQQVYRQSLPIGFGRLI